MTFVPATATTAVEALTSATDITQPAHGFAVGDILTLGPAGVWAKASAAAEASARVAGIVTTATANTFRVATSGRVTGLTALTPGARYYLSATGPGTVTTSSPRISRLIYTADTATSAYLTDIRDQLTGAPQSYLTAERRITAQTGLADGSTLIMDTVTGVNGPGITYNTTTGNLVLAANGTYRITFALRMGATASSWVGARLFNATTSTWVGPTLVCESLASTNAIAPQHTLDHVIATGGTDITLQLRVAGLAGAPQMLGPGTGNQSGPTWLTVEQRPTSVAVPAGSVAATPLGFYSGQAQGLSAGAILQAVAVTGATAYTTAAAVGQRIALPAGSAGGGVTAAGNVITVGSTGRYTVNALITATPTASTSMYVQLVRGTVVVAVQVVSASAGVGVPVVWAGDLTAGDTLDFRVGATSSLTANVTTVSVDVRQAPVATVADPGSVTPTALSYGRLTHVGVAGFVPTINTAIVYDTAGPGNLGTTVTPASGSITVTQPGRYAIGAFAIVRLAASGTPARIAIFVNGVVALSGPPAAASTANEAFTAHVDGDITLAAGDVVTVRPVAIAGNTWQQGDFTVRQVAALSVVSPEVLTPTTLSRMEATLSAPQTVNLTTGTDHIRFNVVDQVVGSGITLDTATAYTSAAGVASLGRFTVRGGGTYRLTANAGLWDTSTAFASLAWFNADSNTRVGPIATLFLAGTDGSDAAATATVTPLADTRYEVRITSGTVTSAGLGSILPSVSISQEPTSSVAYMAPDTMPATALSSSEATAANQTTGLALNSPIRFTTTTGDIPYNAGTFTWTLKAGRPYEFIATIDRVNGTAGVELCYCWFNVTAGTYFGAAATAGLNGQPQGAGGVAIARLTPTTDIQVQVRISKTSATPTSIGPNGAGGAAMTAVISEQAIATIVPANSLTPTAMAEHKWTAIVDATATLPGVVAVVAFPAVTDRVAAGNIASFDGTALTVTAGAHDVAVDALLLTTGTGAHSATFWWRATGDGIGVTYGTGANASAVSSQGFYGQGSTNWAARAVIPAGSTETLHLVHGASSNNQTIQRGSYIHVRELRPQSTVQYVVPPDLAATALARGQVTTTALTQSTTSTAFVDVTGASFTVPNAGQYLLLYTAATNNTTAGAGVYTVITDGANTLIPGTYSQMDEATGPGITGVNAGFALITAAAGATYKLRFRVDGGTGFVHNNTSTEAETSITWVQLPTSTAVSLGALTVTGVPAVGQIPVATSPTAATWAAAPVTGIAPTIVTTKGDLVGGSAASTPVRVPVGGDGLALVADSTAAAGVSYSAQLERRFDQANLATNTVLTAATTVDVANYIAFTQTTQGITATIPSPTAPTKWRTITVENNGSVEIGVTFTSGTGFFLAPNAPRSIVWDGGRWCAQDVNLAVMPESFSFRDAVVQIGNGGTLTFGTRSSETNTGAFSVAGTNITCVRAGRFRVRMDIQVSSSTGNFDTTTWAIRKNGTAVYATPNYIIAEIDGFGAFAQVVSMDTLVDLAAGDIITGVWTGNAGVNNKNVNIEMVGGFAPVLGTSVDFFAGTATGNVSSAAAVPFVASSGNITNTAGVFTLRAGRTYRLSSSIAYNGAAGQSNAASANTFQWRTISPAPAAFGSLAQFISPVAADNATANPTAEAVITPAVDTTVGLFVGNPGTFGLSNGNDGGRSWATIQQLGSTAFADQWIAYTPTIAATASPTLPTTRTYDVRYRVIGKTMTLQFNLFAAASTGATAGTGAYRIPLPAGHTIDLTKVTAVSSVTSAAGDQAGKSASPLGAGAFEVGTTARFSGPLKPVAVSATEIGLHIGLETTSSAVGANIKSTLWGAGQDGFNAADTNVNWWFTAEIPIV